jgi:hypothetical protein
MFPTQKPVVLTMLNSRVGLDLLVQKTKFKKNLCFHFCLLNINIVNMYVLVKYVSRLNKIIYFKVFFY